MSLPEELARTAIAHEEAAPGPGDKVRRTFGVVLARQQTEALAARAIWEEKNIATLVADRNHDHEPIPSLPHYDGPSGRSPEKVWTVYRDAGRPEAIPILSSLAEQARPPTGDA
jgi:hypothetical protein